MSNRRSFLKFLGIAPIAVPAAAQQASVGITIRIENPFRSQPYVRRDQLVDYIGLNKHPDPCFIGSLFVKQIGEWDGRGYPVKLWDSLPKPHRAPMSGVFYDFELCTIREDLIGYDGFWQDPKNRVFENVHEAMRRQRSIEVVDWTSFKQGQELECFADAGGIDTGYRGTSEKTETSFIEMLYRQA